MEIKFKCVNITSKNPKELADFYRKIGFPVYVDDNDYDGWFLGRPHDDGGVCVWDENRWGRATEGTLTIVLDVNDLNVTYEELKKKGLDIDPPRTTDWGGTELVMTDPDGNKIIIL